MENRLFHQNTRVNYGKMVTYSFLKVLSIISYHFSQTFQAESERDNALNIVFV